MRKPRPEVGSGLEEYLHRFQKLNTGYSQGRPKPHKPVMLLAVMSLADNGELLRNEVHYSPDLLELFKLYFDVVAGAHDRRTPWYPFFHLKGDRFWHLHPQPEREDALAVMSGASSVGLLTANVAYASLDDELYNLVCQPTHREALRLAIIDRYFSGHRQELLELCDSELAIGKLRSKWREEESEEEGAELNAVSQDVRSTAFARTVKQAYDYRCAACGMRFLFNEVTLIDAAHLIPFSETRDDSPQNGMALCKNHHWLMDRRLMSPGPGPRRDYSRPIWHVCKHLNDRIEGQKDILALKGKTVILPANERWWPKKDALDRRMELLKEAS